ncbi:ankyrin repeat domain-containing protein [uncultured Chitinophaga sp.]|uniref:ankyrin repeat domain-containing protein n=1 Tax=uncultured Chitinophaga sp. TaxID=339340 RepID=UPI0025F9F9CF|nr:ankyrin repeat domain-containing protein [uncultured Chitinophaga sp.]
MSFFSKLFGKKEPRQPEETPLIWIAAANNRWGVKVLDLRPVTETYLSSSKDPQAAANAVSYNGDDGRAFAGQQPVNSIQFDTDIRLVTDGLLPYGVLFTPAAMEHKWAIFFHQDEIIFVRSWQRQVYVTASVHREPGSIHITSIKGDFAGEEDAETASAILRFLLITHVTEDDSPCPIPAELADTPQQAAIWAFSGFGNLARYGVFEPYIASTKQPLRCNSLLHIAVARADADAIKHEINQGVDINTTAADGNTPLHWAQDTTIMQLLLELGANIDARSPEGATSLMNAVQGEDAEKLAFLLKAGADVNAADNRGFTALHRAAELGLTDTVVLLLQAGADKTMAAQGYTALSLAELRKREDIIDLLK